MRTRPLSLFLFLLLLLPCWLPEAAAQEALAKKYGVQTVASRQAYEELVRQNPKLALVALEQHVPGIHLDIRYATANNLMGEPMYQSPGAFLSVPAADALRRIELELRRQGYGLKVFDAYRPYRVTVAFYERIRDTLFVASPYRGSRHNRGCAVDLTLVNLSTGQELEMPTLFDAFSEKSHIDYQGLPAEVLRNRELLRSVMHKHGFRVYPEEWWHYDFSGWENHPLMDIPFEELTAKKATRKR